MNRDEKKALIQFITIYTFSAFILMGIIAVLYYNKAVSEKTSICKNDLKSTIMGVQMDLMKSAMNHKIYHFKPNHYKLHVGLFDQDKIPIASNLSYPHVDFSKMIDMKPNRVQMIRSLPKPIQDIAYIVAEDIRMPLEFHKLKILIAITILVSMLFVACIGYLLSRLLLKPVKQRISQLDKFIKDSTHEINTPVTALLMSVSALKKKGIKEEKLLRHISISSKLISNIYNTLSHVSFQDIPIGKEEKRFDLKKEILKSIAFFAEIAEVKKITIHTDLSSTYVKMNHNDAAKLINNLLSNAIKYSHNNSNITVTLKDARLSVKDEGIGITPKDQKEILKRYKRASELGGGFGIGLDIVNAICKKYKLSLAIDSKEHEGSLFMIDFSPVR